MARTSRETWAKRVERWKASGLTATEFASRHGIAATSLKWWKWRLGSRDRKGVTRRRRSRALARTTAAQMSPLTFVEMAAAVRGEALELVFPNGLCIRVPAGFDAVALERLLDVLGKRR
ncbi:MAG: hypothetical protein AMXMBFR56_56020 [Polyangiaceae bacterium]